MDQHLKLLAQTPCFEGLGPLGKLCGTGEEAATTATSKLTNFISIAIGIMTMVAFLWFLFLLVTGALSWMASEGEKTKVQTARKKITYGLIGLIIVISAIFIAKIIGTIFGIDFLDIGGFINNIWQ